MKYKLISILVFSFFALFAQAQNDEPTVPKTQENPFAEFEKLFEGLQFMDPGDGMLMDTMIFKQFGNGDFNNPEMDQMMQEMMKMMQEQFQQLDFGNMDGFDKLFEDFDLDGFNPDDLNLDPDAPRFDENGEPIKPKKKRKTYKL